MTQRRVRVGHREVLSQRRPSVVFGLLGAFFLEGLFLRGAAALATPLSSSRQCRSITSPERNSASWVMTTPPPAAAGCWRRRRPRGISPESLTAPIVLGYPECPPDSAGVKQQLVWWLLVVVPTTCMDFGCA